MLGWGTYMLRQAAGDDAQIIAISPDSPAKVAIKRHQKYYMDRGKVIYLCDSNFQDFNTVNWSNFGLHNKADFSAALVYFDDHQSGYRRLIEAQKAGFLHVMYDDGYPWPGDNYALKQACDVDGRILKLKPGASPLASSNSFPYHDDFSNLITTINLSEKKCIYADFLRRWKYIMNSSTLERRFQGPAYSHDGPCDTRGAHEHKRGTYLPFKVPKTQVKFC